MKRIHYLLITLFSITLIFSGYLSWKSYISPSHLSTPECISMEETISQKSKEEFYDYQGKCSTDKLEIIDRGFQWMAISLLLLFLVIILKPDFSSVDSFAKGMVGLHKWWLLLFSLIMFLMIVILVPFTMYVQQQSGYLHQTGDSIWIGRFGAFIQWIVVLIWFLVYILTGEKYNSWYELISLPPITSKTKYILHVLYKLFVLIFWYFFFWYWSVFWLFIILCVRSSHNAKIK